MEVEPWRKRLKLPAYTVKDAARYAGAPVTTVSSWHRAASRFGPALPGREPGKPLSYLQLVEVAFVASFRKAGVKLSTIRKTREYFSQRLGSEFPFAQHRLITDGKNIILDLKEIDPEPDLDLLIITNASGQAAWHTFIGDRIAQFQYLGDLAIRWWPMGQQSPIIIDPRISFGAPTVTGIPTWAIKGRWEAGESAEEIAEDFDLDLALVNHALAFEGVGGAA